MPRRKWEQVVTEDLVVSMIASAVKHDRTIEWFAHKYLGNTRDAYGYGRIYIIVARLLKEGIFVPKFKDREMAFRVDEKLFMGGKK